MGVYVMLCVCVYVYMCVCVCVHVCVCVYMCAWCVYGCVDWCCREKASIPTVQYELPDGKILEIGTDRFMVAENLFVPSTLEVV